MKPSTQSSYVQELYFRYDFVQRAPKPLPLPPWHFRIDSFQQEYLPHTFESTVSLKRRRNAIDDPLAFPNDLDSLEVKQAKRFKRFTAESGAPFTDNFPGLTPVSDPTQLSELQMLCQAMAKWHRPNFPGSLPNLVDSQSLHHLQLKPYCVTWIADGIRFMMLIISKNQVYVFDRSFKCFKVEGLTFPSRNNLQRHLRNTLLDGQMVFDKVDGKVIPRFLVFDIIMINGESVYSHPFLPVRYDCISREIISPRSEAIRQGVIDKTIEPFSIRQKTFHDLSHCQSLLSPSFTGSIGHGSSGLIFQSITDPYVPGVSSSLVFIEISDPFCGIRFPVCKVFVFVQIVQIFNCQSRFPFGFMSTLVVNCKKTEAAAESKDVRPCSSYSYLSSGHLPKNRIPKSWFRCPRKARDFVVDRFLAFKLPVDERYDDNISIDQKFSPEMVIQAVEMRNKTLDLWIDLTTEENFYSCSPLEKKSIQVVSLPCGSSRGPPTITNVGLFIHYVDTSIKRNPQGIVGVHSVHGFNRVGFLIVAYLVERLGFSVNAALATFTNAHPPGIYKQ
uniref:mRNA-capping enzyme n=1 Tax=Phlebotomus papatasi TaxID=29031 RepID=A0A1B0DMK0_PHLPP